MSIPNRVKVLEDLIGEKIRVYLKNTMMIVPAEELGGDEDMVGNAIEAYLVDVDKDFLYMGGNVDDGYSHILDMNDVGLIRIIAEEEEDAEILKMVVPADEEIH